MSELAWFVTGLAILSLFAMYAPHLAGPFVLLILLVLVLKLANQGALSSGA